MKRLMILTLLAASFSIAQPGWTDENDLAGRPAFRGPMMMKGLDLKGDQEKQVDALRSEMQKKQIDLRAKVQSLRVDMRNLTGSDSPDKGKIESKLGEISKLQNEMKLNHLDFWFSVNKILTAEQQKIWKEHGRMMGKMDGPGNFAGGKNAAHPRKMRAHRGQGDRCCNR